jgi:hypothetical protein
MAAVYFANLARPILLMAGLDPDPHITDRKALAALLATMPNTAFEAIDIEISDWHETKGRRHGTWSFIATLTPRRPAADIGAGDGDVYRPRRIRVSGKWRILGHPCSLCPRLREKVDTAKELEAEPPSRGVCPDAAKN